ncbi:transcriptional regulator, partial [Bacillus wiedmannii]
VSDGSEVRFIMVLTIVLIFSVVLEKGNANKTTD